MEHSWREKAWKTFLFLHWKTWRDLFINNVILGKLYFYLSCCYFFTSKKFQNFGAFNYNDIAIIFWGKSKSSGGFPQKYLFCNIAFVHLPKPWEMPVTDFILVVDLLVYQANVRLVCNICCAHAYLCRCDSTAFCFRKLKSKRLTFQINCRTNLTVNIVSRAKKRRKEWLIMSTLTKENVFFFFLDSNVWSG